MKVKNTKVLMPAIAVAVVVLGGGYYSTQLVSKKNDFSKAAAYTSAVNTVDPSTAPDNYEIKFTDENFKRALNSVLKKADPSRDLNAPITAGEAKTITQFWPEDAYRNFSNIEGIQYLTNLTNIHVASITNLKDISPAADLTKINTAYLSGSGITDISAVKNWKNVQTLWVHDNPITDFSPLKDLPKASVYGIRSSARIKVSKGQKIFKNPFINFDGSLMPIEENDNFINVDQNGNPQKDGGYIKIKPDNLKGSYSFGVNNNKEALLNGNKFDSAFNNAYNKSQIFVDGIDVNSSEKPDIYFSIRGSNILLKESAPLVWSVPRQNNSTLNETVLNSLKQSYSPQNGGTFFQASSSTSNIRSLTSDAEEVFNNKENQINGDFLITVTAENEFGNTTTAKFRILFPAVSREPAKEALDNFENQPDYIKNAVPAELVAEAKRVKDQPLEITKENVENAAEALGLKIEELLEAENEHKTEVANAIPELKKKIEDIADFKDVFEENNKILDPAVKKANLEALDEIAKNYAKNGQKLEDALNKIADLKNLDKYTKETLAKLHDAVQIAAQLTTATPRNAEELANSTEDIASESEILDMIKNLENATKGLRADKTALNAQISAFETLPEWLKKEVKTEAEKAKAVQKAANPTVEQVQKATEDLKNAIEKAKKAEENRQKEASSKIDEAEDILAENESKPDELPVIDIEQIEELISKVKDETKRKELTEKLQEIKEKIKAKEAKIESDKLEAARKKRDAEIAKQRLNSPETGYLRNSESNKNEASVSILVGLFTLIASPVIVLLAKKRNKKSKRF